MTEYLFRGGKNRRMIIYLGSILKSINEHGVHLSMVVAPPPPRGCVRYEIKNKRFYKLLAILQSKI